MTETTKVLGMKIQWVQDVCQEEFQSICQQPDNPEFFRIPGHPHVEVEAL
eukprot:CAMPEP_0114049870 /NCGR_PEP_ID=MMETSP1339-20121228/60491_1 /TAXON_ID=94617 /ORGANISM="Fibrocapsa japonica" /LENGTH=49 /assembly_acc=CAM_ASM_000762